MFSAAPGKTHWINANGGNWGELILDFSARGNRAMHLQESSIRGKIDGVRFPHLVGGCPDLSASGTRYKKLLKALDRQSTGKRKPPLGRKCAAG